MKESVLFIVCGIHIIHVYGYEKQQIISDIGLKQLLG